MKIKRVVWLLIALVSISLVPAYSYLMGRFSTLDRQIERSDAIAVVSVAPGYKLSMRGATPVRCFVQETLKGEIAPQKEVTLSLTDPENFIDFGRAYLVFLANPSKSSTFRAGTAYESLAMENAVIKIAYPYDGLPTKGATTKEKIQTLIRQHIKQRDKAVEQENVLLNKMLK